LVPSAKEGAAVSIEPTKIRVLAVDDHALLRYGIASLVNAQPDMELVAQAATGREALEQFRQHRPDVTLMDLQMPDMNGIEAIIGIRSEFPDARIIVLTTYTGDVQVVRALRAGARGYLLKGNVHTDLVETIRAVHAGEKRIPAEIAAELAEHAGEDKLTAREMDVLRLIAKGNANKEIAAQLSITEETVKSHVTRLLDKLRANDRTHAVTIGLQRGIIELQTSPKSRKFPSQF
jgi:DNA-binding NarL/FixJ family response regulator